MTDNIVKSIEKYLKSVANLSSFVYEDSSVDLSEVYSIHSENTILGTATTFKMIDNADDVALTGFDADYFIGWSIKYTGGSSDIYRYITAYNTATGEVTINEEFSATDILNTELFDLVILDAIFVYSGSNYQSYMKINATEEKDLIFLRMQTKEDSDRFKISNYAYSIKKDLIFKKKRLPIYSYDSDGVEGGICGYMKITSSIDKSNVQNDDVQIQKSLMSFTVSYTMNYMR